MNKNHQDVINSMLKECSRHDQSKKQARRYSKQFKENLKFLYIQGYSKKELIKLIPVSIFSIEQWTKDISPPLFKKINLSENKKSRNLNKPSNQSKINDQIIFNQMVMIFFLTLLLVERIFLH